MSFQQGLSGLHGASKHLEVIGSALATTPTTGAFGALQGRAVEQSNVDLKAELVNMIVAQRVYQANSQTIKVQDTVLQTLVSLR